MSRRIPNEIELEILRTPTEKLMEVPFIVENATRSGTAYMIAKRVNHLQAQKAAATTWKARRARINTISPGIIVTPLAYDEFNAAGEGYQRMIDASAAPSRRAMSPARRSSSPPRCGRVILATGTRPSTPLWNGWASTTST